MTNVNCIDTNLALDTRKPAVTWRARLDTVVRFCARGVLAAFNALAEWNERAHQRRQLMELDDHMLADLGLSRADVVREADRPFWQI